MSVVTNHRDCPIWLRTCMDAERPHNAFIDDTVAANTTATASADARSSFERPEASMLNTDNSSNIAPIKDTTQF